ncbi:MAG: hypothetical protein A3K19_18235 [Lentisphaerae bacterium RIFOXYB12_FULL_65_16]|nr:MAG: hypothetical protein A3K18_09625 [Lentisphaerae bacterium RIFOXYA12_64_32]OGV90218.1 MAG: hypothetical protein A3K19_18235 [Lentisphaerae bacterium RIFOXYB12_FULL_65_16]
MRKVMAKLLVGAVLTATVSALAGLDVTRYIPQGTKIVLRVDLKAALQSELMTAILQQQADKFGLVQEFLSQNVGIALSDVDTLWLLSSQPNAGVVVCKGRFDGQAVRARFGNLPNVTDLGRQDCDFACRFLDAKKNTMQMGAVVDAETMVVGDETSVMSFLATLQGAAKSLPADQPRLERLKNDKSVLAGTLIGPAVDWPGADKEMARYVIDVWASGGLAKDVDVVLNLGVDSPEHAEGIGHIIQGFVILKSDDSNSVQNPLLRSLLRAITVTQDENRLAITVKAPGDQIQQLAAQGR